MSNEERNPKRDPAAGDRIKVGNWVRRVISRDGYKGYNITYIREGRTPQSDRRGACWISTWETWARKGEVLTALEVTKP